MRTCLYTAVATVVICISVSTAAQNASDSELAFETLELSMTDSNQLHLEYSVSTSDWQAVRKAGLEPKLNLYVLEDGDDTPKYAHSVDMPTRRGSFTYPAELSPSQFDGFVLEAVGYEKAIRINRIRAHGLSAPRLIFNKRKSGFSVSARSPTNCRLASDSFEASESTRSTGNSTDQLAADLTSTQPGWTLKLKKALVDTCSDSSDAKSTAKVCRESGIELPPDWSIDAMEACAEVANEASGQTECMKIAAEFDQQPPAPAIRACNETSYGSDFELCLGNAADFDTDPAAIISTCEEVTSFRTGMKTCLEAAKSYKTAPPPILRACKAETNYPAKMRECFEAGKTLGPGGEKAITNCKRDSLPKCIDKASTGY